MSPDDLMLLAIEQARLALAHDEVPIGAVVYHGPSGRVIGRGHNRRILDRDPTAHAEIIAIREAAGVVGDWRLEETILAVTLEPCPMCAGAIVNARVPRLVYGCADPKAGAVRTLMRLCEDPRLNHRVAVEAGVRSAECAAMLTDFFAAKRAMGKK
jgi:tRNA(adenine34) deaminase